MNSHPNTDVQSAADDAAEYLNRIARLFKPGVKLTLVVRTPGFPDRDFILTNDAFAEAIAALQRRADPLTSEAHFAERGHRAADEQKQSDKARIERLIESARSEERKRTIDEIAKDVDEFTREANARDAIVGRIIAHNIRRSLDKRQDD